MAPVLSLKNLTTEFRMRSGVVTAVDGVSFDVAAGESDGFRFHLTNLANSVT